MGALTLLIVSLTVDLGSDAFPELLSLCVVLGSIGIFLLWLVRLDVRRS